MLSFLTKTWNNYKALAWWKKLLLALPLVVLVIVCVALFFVRPGRSDQLVEHVEHHKDKVDERIAKNDKREDSLKKIEKKVSEAQESLEKQIRENQVESVEIVNQIDIAVKNNDLEELERLRKRINSM